MPAIHLLDDNDCAALHPFQHVDGVGGIRMGAFTQQERWSIVEQQLMNEQPAFDNELWVNARWVPDGNTVSILSNLSVGTSLVQDEVVLAHWKGAGSSNQAKTPDEPVFLLAHSNQLFTELSSQLPKDKDLLGQKWDLKWAPDLPHTGIFGRSSDIGISIRAVVRAASINTEEGMVIIGPDAIVEPGVHLKGPLVIGEGTTVRMGTRISGPTSIGPHCKVGGELSNVSFQGWANKAHDGFLGNSVIGRWCNLGAGTESSNLKNTYGEVRQWNAMAGGLTGTGLQFCGLLMGDHSKCGIGTTFNTGTVIDPACVIFDAGFPPKHLPPFSWYNARTENMQVQSLDRMLDTAAKVMERRGVKMSEDQRDKLTRLYEERVQSGS